MSVFMCVLLCLDQLLESQVFGREEIRAERIRE